MISATISSLLCLSRFIRVDLVNHKENSKKNKFQVGDNE